MFWVAHASRVLAMAARHRGLFSEMPHRTKARAEQRKFVAARRRNQHARRVRSPDIRAQSWVNSHETITKVQNNSGLDLCAARIRMRRCILRYQTHRHGERLGERTETRPCAHRLRCSGGGRGNVHEQSGLRSAGESERETSSGKNGTRHRREFRKCQCLHRKTRTAGG